MPRPHPGVAVHSRASGDVAVVTVRGEVDLATEQAFARALSAALAAARERDARGVVVDLHGVFLDRRGLAALTAFLSRAQTSNPPVALAALSPLAQQVLPLLGFAGSLPCYDTVTEALRGLQTGGAPAS